MIQQVSRAKNRSTRRKPRRKVDCPIFEKIKFFKKWTTYEKWPTGQWVRT